MPSNQVVTHSSFIKGVVGNTALLSQPKGSVRRVSNLILLKQGALKTCDGSFILSSYNGVFSGGSWLDIELFQPNQVARYYVGLLHNAVGALSPPTAGQIAFSSTTSGTLSAGTTYYYKFTFTNIVGETTASAELSYTITVGNNAIAWTVTLPSGASGYNVYGRTIGNEQKIVGLAGLTPGGDYGTFTPSGLPPSSNTTAGDRFLTIPTPTYDFTTSVGAIPTATIQAVGSGSGFTPNGGISGKSCPIPQLIQFGNQMILILGNGSPLGIFTDPNSLILLTSSTTPSFPAWVANKIYNPGDIISTTISGNSYFQECTQGGISGGTAPTFSSLLAQSTVDNQVIWLNVGTNVTSAVPPGAAHGIIYGNALWVGNTSPTTVNNLDGPSAIRMSNVGVATAWNALNSAFLDKDDGDEIMGWASFAVSNVGIPPQGALVCFKNFKTFLINGIFGASNFQIQKAATDLGCIAPRSIQFIRGHGVFRLTHQGIALFDGIKDTLLSEPLRPYLFGGESDITAVDFTWAYFSKGTQSVSPPMYVLACPLIGGSGVLSRIFCYDLNLQAWTIVDLPFNISVLKQVRYEGASPLNVVGGYSDGKLRQVLAGDTTFDGAAISWSAQFPEVFGEGADQRIFSRRINIRGIGSTASLSGTVTYDGTSQTSVTPRVQNLGNNQWTATFDLLVTAKLAHLVLSGTGQSTIEAIDWQVQPKPVEAPLIFA